MSPRRRVLQRAQQLALAAVSASAILACRHRGEDYETEPFHASDPVPPPPPPCEPVDLHGKWMFSVDAAKLMSAEEADRFGQILQEIPPLDSKVMLVDALPHEFAFSGSVFHTKDARVVMIPNGATFRVRSGGGDACSRAPEVELRVPSRQHDDFVLRIEGGR